MDIEPTQPVPLTIWEDGTIRVKDTRLLFEMIVNAHHRGESPEDIFDSFPSDMYSVADFYSAIAYYLNNREMFDAHFAAETVEARKIRDEIESAPGYQEHTERLREKLKKCWAEKNKV